MCLVLVLWCVNLVFYLCIRLAIILTEEESAVCIVLLALVILFLSTRF